MKRVIAIAGIVLVSAGLVSAKDLATYKATYEKEMDGIILAHGMQIMDLGQQYTKALDVLLETVKKKGDLDKTTTVMNEIARFGKEKEMPKDPPGLLDVQNLQSAFTKQASACESDKAKKIILLTSKYDQALAGLQKSLVSSGKLDEAKAVQEERNKVQETEVLKSAKGFLVDYTKPPTPPAQPSKPEKALAVIKPISGFNSVNELKSNAKAWANRDYHWMNVPTSLPVKRFAMIPGGGSQAVIATVESPGYVYIAFTDPKEYKLKSQGWNKTEHIFSYSDKGSATMYVFEKQFQKGKLEIPNLGWSGPVLLLP